MPAPSAEIRPERPADREAVHTVHTRAFRRRHEADLVDALRGRVDPSVSLVAAEAGTVVGHVFFSPVGIEGKRSESRAIALAPLAVLPEQQKRGIGSHLVGWISDEVDAWIESRPVAGADNPASAPEDTPDSAA